MKYFSHYLIASVFFLLSLMSAQAFSAGAYSNGDYSRAQSQADRGFDDFDKQFEDEDDVKAPVPEHKPAPAPVISTAIEKAVSTKNSTNAAPSGAQQRLTKSRSGLNFTLNGCQIDSGTLLCDFSIISPKNDKNLTINGSYHPWKGSRVFDQEGNEYAVTRTTLGNKAGTRYIESLLVSGINVKASIAVDNFNSTGDIDSISLLDLSLVSDNRNYVIQYRNIAITR